MNGEGVKVTEDEPDAELHLVKLSFEVKSDGRLKGSRQDMMMLYN